MTVPCCFDLAAAAYSIFLSSHDSSPTRWSLLSVLIISASWLPTRLLAALFVPSGELMIGTDADCFVLKIVPIPRACASEGQAMIASRAATDLSLFFRAAAVATYCCLPTLWFSGGACQSMTTVRSGGHLAAMSLYTACSHCAPDQCGWELQVSGWMLVNSIHVALSNFFVWTATVSSNQGIDRLCPSCLPGYWVSSIPRSLVPVPYLSSCSDHQADFNRTAGHSEVSENWGWCTSYRRAVQLHEAHSDLGFALSSSYLPPAWV